MKHLTKWSPDTCKCEIIYETDDEHPELDIKVIEVIKVCPYHMGLSMFKQFDAVLEENQRKNFFEAAILNNIPYVVDIVVSADGAERKQLKPNLQYKWSFDLNRKLVIDVREWVNVGIISGVVMDLRTLASNIRFADKVLING